MMLTEAIVLGHHISGSGMRVDLEKIYIITQIKIPSSQKEVRSFLGHVLYKIHSEFYKPSYPFI